MIKPTKVKALDRYKIWIEFEDGVSGEADLGRLAGKGMFKAWDDRNVFESVRIDAPYRTLIWSDSDDLGLCTDTFYMELTGKSWELLTKVTKRLQSVHRGS